MILVIVFRSEVLQSFPVLYPKRLVLNLKLLNEDFRLNLLPCHFLAVCVRLLLHEWRFQLKCLYLCLLLQMRRLAIHWHDYSQNLIFANTNNPNALVNIRVLLSEIVNRLPNLGVISESSHNSFTVKRKELAFFRKAKPNEV